MKTRCKLLSALTLSLFALPALADGWKDESRGRGWHDDAQNVYIVQRDRDWDRGRRGKREVRRAYREGYRDGYRDGDRYGDGWYTERRVVHHYPERRHYGGSGVSIGLGPVVIVLD